MWELNWEEYDWYEIQDMLDEMYRVDRELAEMYE